MVAFCFPFALFLLKSFFLSWNIWTFFMIWLYVKCLSFKTIFSVFPGILYTQLQLISLLSNNIMLFLCSVRHLLPPIFCFIVVIHFAFMYTVTVQHVSTAFALCNQLFLVWLKLGNFLICTYIVTICVDIISFVSLWSHISSSQRTSYNISYLEVC